MYIRVSKKIKNGKTYEYVQLVESFRRKKDGLPAPRVLANLGIQTPQVVENLKLALASSKTGGQLILSESIDTRGFRIQSNLRYLDLAVALAMWDSWNLSAEIKSIAPSDERIVESVKIITALVLHRCVAPGSKLAAVRWFPTTALSKLLDIPATSFNNGRIHRALDWLYSIDKTLQERLPNLYLPAEEKFGALFLDVTDTWFVGRGPELAEVGLTKEGVFQRRIGIVLLCDERGYPIRWKVIAGKRHESLGMFDVINSIAGANWLGDAPVICDRGMSKACYIDKFLASGVKFLTALSVNEYASYSDKIPSEQFAHIDVSDDERLRAKNLSRIGALAEEVGMEKVSKNTFVLDLGVISRAETGEMKKAARLHDSSEYEKTLTENTPIAALRLAKNIQSDLLNQEVSSKADFGRKNGICVTKVTRTLDLLNLSSNIQDRLMNGEGGNLSFKSLFRISRLASHDEQLRKFEQTLAEREKSRSRSSNNGDSITRKVFSGPLEVRGVVFFNPEMFLNQRVQSSKHLKEIESFVADLNERLASPHSHRNESSVHSLITEKLKRREIQDCFEIIVHTKKAEKRCHLEVELIFKKDLWKRRRCYDGFSFLVCSKEMSHTAARLVELYRAKDKIEKDFHIIKSVTTLRPVRHHTDPKVCAHVSLCMLALLLGRTLERKLLERGLKYSCEAAFEMLATCHLNRVALNAGGTSEAYTITQLNETQAAILEALGLTNLSSHVGIGETLPRS